MIGPILGGIPRLKFLADKVSITSDGNSLVRGGLVAAGQTLQAQLAALAPISGAMTIANLGIDGQRTYQMTSNATDVNAAHVASKGNLLLGWEGLNDILGNGSTPQQAWNNVVAYVAARRATNPTNPWRIIWINCLPIYNGDLLTQEQIDAENLKLEQFNSLVAANWRAAGITAVVDLRQIGSVFRVADYQRATLKALAPYFVVESNQKLVHLNAAGYTEVAKMVAETLKRLPAR